MDATNSVSITGGGYSAQISLLGGQLLNLTHQEDELIVPAAETEGAFAGAVLAPWPNRTKGGSYTYAGVEHVLPINEEATGAALHGLLTDLQLEVISQKESEVRLQGWLESSEGYPFGLDIALTYRVSAGVGLAATLMARHRPEELDAQGIPGDSAPQEESEAPGETAESGASEDTEPESGSLDTSDDAASADSTDDDDADVTDDGMTGSETGDGEAEEGGAGEDDTDEGDTDLGDTAETGSDGEEHSAAAPETDAPVSASADPNATGTPTDTATPIGTATATEVSDVEPEPASARQTAPFGAGFHPYLTVGGAPLKECRLRLPATTMLKTKADGTVTARKPVSEDFDLTHGPLLAGRKIDHAYTGLPEEGWTAELVHDRTGFTVRMIADSPWAQVYTGERIDRAGVAVEPMTCPPNALNSGEDLIHLVPGEWFRIGYSIEAIRAA